ncbi:MAG: ABC transporter permease [Verrucomicrobia bacterium]|nr:ABC transporter permease [Verrucomicrobiota bacterium]MBU1734852.1 ABC transporter permease [Verrucomicrobiota bacterium]MBU1857500.1 ABC transporter permease [Verrucomicrobiota bacterium]
MTFSGTIGQHTITRMRETAHLFAVLGSILGQATRLQHWPRTTRAVFARQVLFTGVEALRFVSLVAFLTGISVVVQAQVWLGKAGQSAMLGSVLIAVILREVAPLLVNFIVIGRSGTAIAVELANMKVFGEIKVLEAQGLDTLLYLAIPRALAFALSVFCLTIWFTIVAFVSGYAFGILFGVGATDPVIFMNTILKGLHPADVYNLLAKTLVPGLFTAGICIMEGLSVRYSITEVPQAATRAVVRSIAALFIISAIVSVLTYI